MKRLMTPFLLALAAAAAYGLLTGNPAMSNEDEAPKKLLRHVVLFNFKDDATEQQIGEVVDAFRALPGKIDAIHDFEYGTDNSPEQLARGYTHCFLVTFTSEEDRAEYLPHPAHQAFVQVLRPILEEVLVVDYWASE